MKKLFRYIIAGLIVAASLDISVLLAIRFSEFVEKSNYVVEMTGGQAEEKFLDTIDDVDDLNQGIMIFTRITIFDGPDTKPPYNLDIAVINNTGEAINFPDNGFGVQAFAYDVDKNLWQPVDLGVHPGNIPTVLGAETEIYGNDNWWILNGNWIQTDWHLPFRIFVHGVGIDSNKVYGAYRDIDLSRK